MKKKGFGLIELLIVIAIIAIIAAILLPALSHAKKQAEEINKKQQHSDPALVINVGDSVYIESLSVTGVLNSMPAYGNPMVSIIIKGPNGTPTELEHVNFNILKKVQQPEAWHGELINSHD